MSSDLVKRKEAKLNRADRHDNNVNRLQELVMGELANPGCDALIERIEKFAHHALKKAMLDSKTSTHGDSLVLTAASSALSAVAKARKARVEIQAILVKVAQPQGTTINNNVVLPGQPVRSAVLDAIWGAPTGGADPALMTEGNNVIDAEPVEAELDTYDSE